ncbi:hypothetical protein ABZ714_12500 [Streptomyces sp. NPDC006798]|uniref:hypothetical protein n=1 Tax=Streptomyces sp. NPDC006798 TaxID=3155462 RepID=UPI0033F1C0CB
MEFRKAYSARVLGQRLSVIRRHGLYDPDWCLAKVTEGPGRGQLDQIIRTEFARAGFNCLFDATVVLKIDAPGLLARFEEIGHAERLVLRLLPPAPRKWVYAPQDRVVLEGPGEDPERPDPYWWASDAKQPPKEPQNPPTGPRKFWSGL